MDLRTEYEKLASDLRSTDATKTNKALKRIKEAATSVEHALAIKEAGAITLLVQLIGGTTQMKEQALSALWSLACVDECAADISEPHAVRAIVQVVGSTEPPKVRELAAGVLRILATQDEAKVIIREMGGIPRLLALVDHVPSAACREKALGALLGLTYNTLNQHAFRRFGGIVVLLNVLAIADCKVEVKESAACALHNIADVDENRVYIMRSGGHLHLVSLITDGTDALKEWAAGTLLKLTAPNPTRQWSVDETKRAIRDAGAIAPLYMLRTHGRGDAQRELALRVLRQLNWTEHEGMGNKARFVRVEVAPGSFVVQALPQPPLRKLVLSPTTSNPANVATHNLLPPPSDFKPPPPPKDEFTKMLTEALDEKRAREPAAEIDPELKRQRLELQEELERQKLASDAKTKELQAENTELRRSVQRLLEEQQAMSAELAQQQKRQTEAATLRLQQQAALMQALMQQLSGLAPPAAVPPAAVDTTAHASLT